MVAEAKKTAMCISRFFINDFQTLKTRYEQRKKQTHPFPIQRFILFFDRSSHATLIQKWGSFPKTAYSSFFWIPVVYGLAPRLREG